jgi:hypothetical protein
MPSENGAPVNEEVNKEKLQEEVRRDRTTIFADARDTQPPKPVKRKAVEVILSDGQKALVFEPKTADMGTFLRALPSLVSIQKAFRTVSEVEEGVTGLTVNIPDSVYEELFPLIAIMSNMDLEDFRNLPLFDGLAMMGALTVFMPRNPTKPATAN